MAQQTLQNFTRAATLTKSDTVNSPTLPPGGTSAGGRYPDVIWCGEAGTITLAFDDGSTVIFTVAAGTILPVVAKRIQSTNTAGTLFVGLWQL